MDKKAQKVTGFVKLGLAGWPVAHSLSPLIHRAFMEEAGLSGEYLLVPVKPGMIEEAVSSARNLSWRGMNLTVPHKKAVISVCTFLSPEARETGAVNTLLFEGGSVKGFNTDIEGFKAVSRNLPGPLVVLGKGGAAASAKAASCGREALFLGRGDPFPEELTGDAGTVVNATPLGWNEDDVFPLDIPQGWCFLDLNYSPRWRWRNSLKDRGVRVVTGEAMLVEQAACSFAIWTGYTPGSELKESLVQRIATESGDDHD